MRIFLSYASEERDLAEEMCARLQALGHEVFFDREDLPAGASFDDQIAAAIEHCHLFIFLITPEAVTRGRYTRTELKIASRKWPTPGSHVLPVIARPTPIGEVPAYLRALTLLQPEGNLVAEVVLEVQTLARTLARTLATSDQPHTPVVGLMQSPAAAPAQVGDEGPRYSPLHLHFSRDAPGQYTLAVPNAPVGTQAAAPCLFDPTALEQTLWSQPQPIRGSARRGSAQLASATLLPDELSARQVGEQLHATLFESAVGDCLQQNLRTVNAQRGEGLRILIDTTATPELARLPWEFLYNPQTDDYLCSDRMKPIVRWLEVPDPPPTLAVQAPLRLLVAAATPDDYPALKAEREIAQLRDALSALHAGGQVLIHQLEHANLETLDAALLAHRPHILHFIGHGDFVRDEGVLVLEPNEIGGAANTIAGRQLAVLLRNHLTSLRLVFLNSCMGATASALNPFSGLAQSLLRRGIPAVIAMQFPIPDEAAAALARHFYRYLANGQPVDAALTSARAFLFARGYEVEWGAPALHMRAADGRLFQLSRTHTAKSAAPVVVPSPIRVPAPAPSAPVAPAAAQEVGAAARPRVPQPTRQVHRESRGRRFPWIILTAALVAMVALAMFAVPNFLRVGSAPGQPNPPVITDPGTDPGTGPDIGPDTGNGSGTHTGTGAGQGSTGNPSNGDDGSSEHQVTEAQLDATVQALRTPDRSLDALMQMREALGSNPNAYSTRALGQEPQQHLLSAMLDASEAYLLIDQPSLAEQALQTVWQITEGELALDPTLTLRIEAIETQILNYPPPPNVVTPAPAAQVPVTVLAGDTLWGIAQRLTGEGRHWPVLLSAHNRQASNSSVAISIDDPDLIYPGQILLVPLSARQQLSSQGTPADATTARKDGERYIEYHVTRGDALSKIAERFYADPHRWRQVFQHNNAQIQDPNLIYPGQILRVLTPE